MKIDFKDLHIGSLIETRVTEKGIDIDRICSFMKRDEEDIKKMYASKNLDSDIILRWSKLLEYDFFRFFSQHLILYAPPSNSNYNRITSTSALPEFRKNLYTTEVIDFILDLLANKEKTKLEIMKEYRIPKSTLHRWIEKYKK
ncbi:transposase [Chryseobacterium luteum]|uniref:Transposase n=1 Tax=Chryseobacterium luteum TaxID=421531 RepID=A0A085ZF71_9FLAO|nr:transposase [Chryseobacterium luteum]KFF03085.1 transposase [Chryseobacterium luteum]